jgi:hypothetical protein
MEKDTFDQFKRDQDEEEILGAEAGIRPPEGYDPDEGFEPAILSIELEESDTPPEEDDGRPCPNCNGLGTVPNTNDASFNVRMTCPTCAGAGRVEYRLVFEFPFYVQYLLARGIHDQHREIFPFVAERGHLAQFDDDTLATFADELADRIPAAISGTTPETTARRRAYLRILAVALRHFQTEPASVAACVALVRGIAQTGKRRTK